MVVIAIACVAAVLVCGIVGVTVYCLVFHSSGPAPTASASKLDPQPPGIVSVELQSGHASSLAGAPVGVAVAVSGIHLHAPSSELEDGLAVSAPPIESNALSCAQ